MLLMLEDDHERIERFTAVLTVIAPSLPLVIWRSAKKMVREVEPFLPSACLISLDHDLEPQEGDLEDPGDGIDVARFLAGRAPFCPVIVHSSNGTRSGWMMGEFELGGWEAHRVAPIGEDWIESYWRVVVRKLLRAVTPRLSTRLSRTDP
jgi:hypothetical protein